MTTLKEKMIMSMESQVKDLLEQIGKHYEMKEKIRSLTGLDVECGDNVGVWVGYYGSISVTCIDPGKAQEVANAMAVDLDTKMEKSFIESSGEHKYVGYSKDHLLYITVSGNPPTDCKIEWEEKDEVRRIRKAKITCE